MKKILAILFAFLLIVGLAIPVQAESYYDNGNGEYGTGEIEVTYRAYSTIDLEIPLSVSADSQGQIVATNPNIEDGYQFNIYVTNLNENGYIVLNHANGGDVYGVLKDDSDNNTVSAANPLLATFNNIDFAQSLTSTSTFTINCIADGMLSAGYYSGNICYRIECNPIA